MTLKRCPQCAEEIQSEARICRFCNARLDGSSEPKPPPNSFQSLMGCLGRIVLAAAVFYFAIYLISGR